jgi:hypothetical protein
MVRRDQVETPAQRCGKSDGDESRRLLVDAAQRMSPLAQKYLEDEPQATQFRRSASDEPVEGLAERLDTRRVVLQLGGANLGDVACARFSRSAGGPTCRWPGAPVEAALVTLAAPLTWCATSTALKIRGDRRNVLSRVLSWGALEAGLVAKLRSRLRPRRGVYR